MNLEESVVFSVNGLRLEGRLHLPGGATQAVVVAHPHPQYGGNMDNNVVLGTVRSLQQAGFSTLRFNFRGVGRSEGAYGNVTGEVEDIRSALDLTKHRTGLAQLDLVGYSFGAVVALLAGHDHTGVRRLVAIAPPVSMVDLSFLASSAKPLLFLCGTNDSFCPPDGLERVTRGLGPNVERGAVPGADHFFFGFEGEIGSRVADFLHHPGN